MGCQIHTLNPQLFYTRTHSRLNLSKQPSKCLSSCNINQQLPISTTSIKKDQIPTSDVKFKTLGSCKLGISRYPDFQYNAQGGTGTGRITSETDSNGEVSINFDIDTLYIPPLSTATTKFLGLPLPPFLRIDIVPDVFQGNINQESGKVDLRFRANFWFSVGSIYKAPPLLVETVLTSEESNGEMRRGTGERLKQDGMCRLVGVARIEPINDAFMDTFLRLPTECLADLSAQIAFSSTQ